MCNTCGLVNQEASNDHRIMESVRTGAVGGFFFLVIAIFLLVLAILWLLLPFAVFKIGNTQQDTALSIEAIRVIQSRR